MIRDKFNYAQIEVYGHMKEQTPDKEKASYQGNCLQILNELHKVLIQPLAEPIAAKKRLIIVTSKYLSYVPFAALVQSIDPQGRTQVFGPGTKPSPISGCPFSTTTSKPGQAGPVLDKAKMLVVGNPVNDRLRLPSRPLGGGRERGQDRFRVGIRRGSSPAYPAGQDRGQRGRLAEACFR